MCFYGFYQKTKNSTKCYIYKAAKFKPKDGLI